MKAAYEHIDQPFTLSEILEAIKELKVRDPDEMAIIDELISTTIKFGGRQSIKQEEPPQEETSMDYEEAGYDGEHETNDQKSSDDEQMILD
ncbi:hypothetical protein FGO68_gene1543 [Halteria grandinella]|uniref:Uncharacterized protein n=1 Tax=Halteria grandinella TaxID=5974 RepID=A0A8J8NL42_HALGN|nr:hypothetical protein FGO68_gene1543 [Halteria grandinella]